MPSLDPKSKVYLQIYAEKAAPTSVPSCLHCPQWCGLQTERPEVASVCWSKLFHLNLLHWVLISSHLPELRSTEYILDISHHFKIKGV